MITSKNQGVATPIMMMVVTTCKKHVSQPLKTKNQFKLRMSSFLWLAYRIVPGIVVSTTSMSLLNLLTIRPKGVVSKNIIGERNILYSKFLCSVTAASRVPFASANDPTQTRMANNFC